MRKLLLHRNYFPASAFARRNADNIQNHIVHRPCEGDGRKLRFERNYFQQCNNLVHWNVLLHSKSNHIAPCAKKDFSAGEVVESGILRRASAAACERVTVSPFLLTQQKDFECEGVSKMPDHHLASGLVPFYRQGHSPQCNVIVVAQKQDMQDYVKFEAIATREISAGTELVRKVDGTPTNQRNCGRYISDNAIENYLEIWRRSDAKIAKSSSEKSRRLQRVHGWSG